MLPTATLLCPGLTSTDVEGSGCPRSGSRCGAVASRHTRDHALVPMSIRFIPDAVNQEWARKAVSSGGYAQITGKVSITG